MTKAEIIARIDGKVGLSKNHATDVVEATFEIIKSCLEKGENVKISGFGSFVVRSKNPRRGRNPKTGEEIIIKGRRVLTFKASTTLKETINKISSTAPQVPPTSVIPD
ncbi:MAG: integration host factor subunit alpha [Deltaproteobacteria bacterium]|nr:integration host factor subunit alpha [Deltaproteobacteria bacterium]